MLGNKSIILRHFEAGRADDADGCNNVSCQDCLFFLQGGFLQLQPPWW